MSHVGMKVPMVTPHGKNLRIGRFSMEGQTYVVTAVTAGRTPHFLDLYAGRMVVNAMRHQEERGDVESLAFVVMPDHLHWLVSLTGQKTLSEVMQSVKGHSSHEINAHRGKDAAPTGKAPCSRMSGIPAANPRRIWQKGFYDHALRREEDIVNVARYIVMNPVRSKLVSNIWQYSLWDAVWV